MQIDDIIDKLDSEIPGIGRIRDAVVFMIDEDSIAFAKQAPKESEGNFWCLDAFASPLPYGNCVLQMRDVCMWCFMVPRARFVRSEPSDIGFGVLTYFRRKERRDIPGWVHEIRTWRCNSDLQIMQHGYVKEGNWSNIYDVFEANVGSRLHSFTEGMILKQFLSLLSCKNIREKTVVPPARLQASRRKKGKVPLVSYRVLEITPATSWASREGSRLWTNRVHLCRGHMAEYGVDGKGLLFGKYAGRFWIPPHVKGDKSKGLVVKDYRLPRTHGNEEPPP